VFAVIVTGAPGVGKTTYLMALTDVLADDGIEVIGVRNVIEALDAMF